MTMTEEKTFKTREVTGRPHSEHPRDHHRYRCVLASIVVVRTYSNWLSIVLSVISGLYAFIIGSILYVGLKVLTKNEALVLTLFGKYYGTLKQDGFFFVNPFCAGFNPTIGANNPSTGAVKRKRTLYCRLRNERQLPDAEEEDQPQGDDAEQRQAENQ